MRKNKSASPLAIWLSATRPRTLPAAVAPVLLASALAWSEARHDWVAASLCLGFALLAQIAANFANDYFDFVKGADTAERVGPKRAVAAGLISPKAMKLATMTVCAAAFCIGLGLIPFGGWPLLVVGISSIVCAVAYTGGPFPLAYKGLGDVFVFVFFGVVAVCCTYYVQAGDVSVEAIICSIPMGMLATNILVANNYRDVETDRKAGKMTLVVRLGRPFAKAQFVTAHVMALATPLLLIQEGYDPSWAAWLALVPLCVWSYRLCSRLTPQRTPKELIGILAGSGLYLFAYAVALSLWILDASR